MADSGTGIQELMAAETRASQIVAEARIGEYSENRKLVDGVERLAATDPSCCRQPREPLANRSPLYTGLSHSTLSFLIRPRRPHEAGQGRSAGAD